MSYFCTTCIHMHAQSVAIKHSVQWNSANVCIGCQGRKQSFVYKSHCMYSLSVYTLQCLFSGRVYNEGKTGPVACKGRKIHTTLAWNNSGVYNIHESPVRLADLQYITVYYMIYIEDAIYTNIYVWEGGYWWYVLSHIYCKYMQCTTIYVWEWSYGE